MLRGIPKRQERNPPRRVRPNDGHLSGIKLSPTRREVDPGKPFIPTTNCMAWRPYTNLIEGELDNHIPGKVTGWMRFFRHRKRPLRVNFFLAGDFHEDIRGKMIRLTNSSPSDKYATEDRGGTYMDGFSAVQRGQVGDITAGFSLGPWTEDVAQRLMAQNEIYWDDADIRGLEREIRGREFADRYRAHIAAGDLYYPYVDYPYIEWYAANGRVVLELDPSQLEVLRVGASSSKDKTPSEFVNDRRKRVHAMESFLSDMVKGLSDENRKQGGDGSVSGGLVG
jgi:hypothetical protein